MRHKILKKNHCYSIIYLSYSRVRT